MSIFRVYHPHECHPLGHPLALQPLDWECCRACDGRTEPCAIDGKASGAPFGSCGTCDGFDSLKAAALAELTAKPARKPGPYRCGHCGSTSLRVGMDNTLHCTSCLRSTRWADANRARDAFDALPLPVAPVRCEDCHHPMSEGTWEAPTFICAYGGEGVHGRYALQCLQNGREPDTGCVHYSPCDRECDHGGAGRLRDGDLWFPSVEVTGLPEFERSRELGMVEASWRPVDIRTLSFPNILLPECLAVLCLRCYTERKALWTS